MLSHNYLPQLLLLQNNNHHHSSSNSLNSNSNSNSNSNYNSLITSRPTTTTTTTLNSIHLHSPPSLIAPLSSSSSTLNSMGNSFSICGLSSSTTKWNSPPRAATSSPPIAALETKDPLKIMISGAPASGKGTQCDFITKKYGLVHIAAGDLLRAEVSAGTEKGRKAKEYMEKGQLVPDEIVVMMVKGRLLQDDAQEKGWLLDGYPRSVSQARALEELGIRPDLFIVLDVPEDLLVERVVGRRLDPVTGKIYHLKYSPPETQEIADRLTQRFDDTEEKVKLRLVTHRQNVDPVMAVYDDLLLKVNGDASMEDVFSQIDSALSSLVERKHRSEPVSMAAST